MDHSRTAGLRGGLRCGDRIVPGRRALCLNGHALRLPGQMPHLGQNLNAGVRVGHGSFCRAFFEHRPNLIERGERQIDQLRADLEPSVAHLVEGRLQIVRKSGHILEAEHGPRTLDGVQGAKDPFHQLHVAVVVVQLQQRRLQIHKNLARLFPEALFEDVGIAYG